MIGHKFFHLSFDRIYMVKICFMKSCFLLLNVSEVNKEPTPLKQMQTERRSELSMIEIISLFMYLHKFRQTEL